MAEPILISACLLDLPTRYDGSAKPNEPLKRYLQENNFCPVPICPEQLGGLPTPRPACKLVGGDGEDAIKGHARVVGEDEIDRTIPFIEGARMVLHIGQLSGCRRAILKERSPSCGVHRIHRGTELVKGQGVTAALLRQAGIDLMSEEDL